MTNPNENMKSRVGVPIALELDVDWLEYIFQHIFQFERELVEQGRRREDPKFISGFGFFFLLRKSVGLVPLLMFASIMAASLVRR